MKTKFNDGFFAGDTTEEEKRTDEGIKKASAKGLRDGLTRYTFIVEEEQLEKIKALAYFDRLSMKEIASEILQSYLDKAGASKVNRALKEYKNKKF